MGNCQFGTVKWWFRHIEHYEYAKIDTKKVNDKSEKIFDMVEKYTEGSYI